MQKQPLASGVKYKVLGDFIYGKSEGKNLESIRIKLGSATTLSNSVLKYQSAVQFTYEANDVKGVANMKSLLNILAAEVNQGQVIEISCTGDDEEEALKSVLDAVNSGIGELV